MGLDIVILVNDVSSDKLTQHVSSVEVSEKMDHNTSYTMKFMIDVCDGDIAKPIENETSPGKILSVMAKVNNGYVCLVKGPVIKQETHLQHGGEGSWLNIEGEDTGRLMDHETKFKVGAGKVSDSEVAANIIGSYDHMTADVEQTPKSVHKEEDHSHVQRETDLSLLRSLARRNGFHFWITCSTAGKGTGHFRSRSLDGNPATVLVVNQDNYNIDSLRITADTSAPSQTIGKQLDLHTKKEISGNFTLNDPTLGKDGLAVAAGSKAQSMHLAPTVDDPGAMEARNKAALRESQWFIRATCHTSIHRLCNIVRNHTIVEVRGAGTKHSGKYYVTGVKHTIDAVSHNMELELARNAWGA